MSEALKRRVRCAVYTRKSTDEGLDQEYNSIDAQSSGPARAVSTSARNGASLSASCRAARQAWFGLAQ